VNLRKAVYEQRIKQIEDDMLPVGFINDGQQEEVVIDTGDVWGNYNREENNSPPPGYLSSRL
jgi:hypothetical protein